MKKLLAIMNERGGKMPKKRGGTGRSVGTPKPSIKPIKKKMWDFDKPKAGKTAKKPKKS